jgi:hypothetical protein
MNDQTLQALTALAEKLGTTGEHLWGILVAKSTVRAFEAGNGVLIMTTSDETIATIERGSLINAPFVLQQA